MQAHIESCAACAQEFKSMQATFALLDTWKAPEPSPYFDQKLAVRLREEQTLAHRIFAYGVDRADEIAKNHWRIHPASIEKTECRVF